jgi:hypothetical protein
MGRMGDSPLLFIFDCEAAPLAPALFHRVAARPTEFATSTRARNAVLYTSGEDDPLRVAALIGIALALDEGRSLA